MSSEVLVVHRGVKLVDLGVGSDEPIRLYSVAQLIEHVSMEEFGQAVGIQVLKQVSVIEGRSTCFPFTTPARQRLGVAAKISL
jgi:hypothetical protein